MQLPSCRGASEIIVQNSGLLGFSTITDRNVCATLSIILAVLDFQVILDAPSGSGAGTSIRSAQSMVKYVPMKIV